MEIILSLISEAPIFGDRLLDRKELYLESMVKDGGGGKAVNLTGLGERLGFRLGGDNAML